MTLHHLDGFAGQAIGQVFFLGAVVHLAVDNLELFLGRNHDLLGHVPDRLVGHHQHRHSVLLRIVEGLQGEIEALLGRDGRERDDLVVAV